MLLDDDIMNPIGGEDDLGGSKKSRRASSFVLDAIDNIRPSKETRTKKMSSFADVKRVNSALSQQFSYRVSDDDRDQEY